MEKKRYFSFVSSIGFGIAETSEERDEYLTKFFGRDYIKKDFLKFSDAKKFVIDTFNSIHHDNPDMQYHGSFKKSYILFLHY